MQIVSLLFLFLIPLFSLIFTMRFKGIMALVIVAPTMMLFVAILMLNQDPTVSIIYPPQANSTETQAGPQGFVTTITGDTPVLVTHVLITNSTNQILLNAAPGGNIFAGEHFNANSSLVGEKIDTISLKLSKTGNPAGSYQIGVFDTSFTPKQIFCSPVAGTLLTTPTFTTCRLPVGTYYEIVSGDAIGVEFIDDNHNNVGVNMFYVNTDYFDGSNTTKTVRSLAGVWSYQATQDATIALLFHDTQTGIVSVESTVYDSFAQVTRTEFDANSSEVTYTIEPQTMTIIDGMTTVVGLLLIFVVWRRITKDPTPRYQGE